MEGETTKASIWQRVRRNWLLVLIGLVALKAGMVGMSLNFYDIRHMKANSTVYGWDTTFYYIWLRSAVLDFDMDFENDIQLADTLPENEREFALGELPRTETGMLANKYPIGWAMFHAPWFVLGHGAALGLNAAGFDVRTDGYGRVYELFLYTGSLLYAALSMWLTYALLIRVFERKIALASLLLVWTSGLLIYYQLRQYAMAHNLTYLCLVSTFYWIYAIREFPPLKRNWLMLGLSVGMLAITRYQAVVYLLFPFLLAVWEIVRLRTTVKAVLYCVLGILVPVALQLACWKGLYGSWLVYTYTGEGFLWAEPKLFATLFDPNHGLVYWHPIFLVGIVGLFGFLAMRKEGLAWTWLVSIAAVTYINAAWHCWWFGVSFGNRAYEGVTLFVFFGVAALLYFAEKGGRWVKGVTYAALLALCVWNIGVLEVTMYSWQTGVGLAGAETHGELAQAIWERWVEGKR